MAYRADVIRLRQVALVAADRDAVVAELCRFLAVGVCYEDPGVAVFGLHNASDGHRRPVPRGRQPDDRRHDGRPPARQARRRRGLHGHLRGRRSRPPGGPGGVAGRAHHLEGRPPRHPGPPPPPSRCRRGHRLDRPAGTAGLVEWGGPWSAHAETDVVTAIAGVDVAAADPDAMRARWRELDVDHAVRFVPATARGEGIDAVDLVATDRSEPAKRSRSAVSSCGSSDPNLTRSAAARGGGLPRGPTRPAPPAGRCRRSRCGRGGR